MEPWHSKFNDLGVNALFYDIAKEILNFNISSDLESLAREKASSNVTTIIPRAQVQYLRDIAETCRKYNKETEESIAQIKIYETLVNAIELAKTQEVKAELQSLIPKISSETLEEIEKFDEVYSHYRSGLFKYTVRDKEIKVETKYISLSGTSISRVGLPHLDSKAQKYRFLRSQNLPGFSLCCRNLSI